MHHRIKAPITFTGLNGSVTVEAIIDTGATVSMIPWELAAQINAGATGLWKNVTGVHGQSDDLPIGLVGVAFPTLENRGAPSLGVVVTNNMSEALIGMDVMSPLGITIDTGSATLAINNTAWELFKNFSAALVGGGAVLGLIAVAAEALSESPPKKKRSRSRSSW